MSFKSLQDYQMTKSAGYDLLFFENRRTPMIVRTGASYRTEERYGRLISRRPATRGELEQLKSGMFVRNLELEDTPYNEPEETPVERDEQENQEKSSAVIAPAEEEEEDLLEEDFAVGRKELEAAQREMMIADAVRNAISSGVISAGASGLLTGGFTAAQPGATGSDIVGRSLVGAGIGGVSGAGLSGFLSWLDGRSGKDFIDKMGPEGLYAGAEVTHPGVLRHPDMWQGGHLSPYGRDRLIRNSIGIL